MTALFVTGIGTDIGKTFCIEHLLKFDLTSQIQQFCAIKPLITGWTGELKDVSTSDTGKILLAQGKSVTPENIQSVSPWRYRAALAPDLAQQRENCYFKFNDLIQVCEHAKLMAKEKQKILLIEGVGGVMSPISEQYTVVDWIKALSIPVLVVSGTYLGSITHLLTALNALMHFNIQVPFIILNESKNSNVTLEETKRSIQKHTKIPLITISRHDHIEKNERDYAIATDFCLLHRKLITAFSSQ